MKIELISPLMRSPRNIGEAFHLPQMSLALLASLTPPEIDVSITDELVQPIDFNKEADLIGITVNTKTALRAYEIADRYRSRGVPVVLGGIHPKVARHEAMQHANAIVLGEAEGKWMQLLEDFRNDRLKTVYGSDKFPSLKLSPFPKRELFQSDKYDTLNLVQTSRGCPYTCHFCSVSSHYGKGIRMRPVDSVIAEIKTLKGNEIFFVDDNIVGKSQNARQLFTRLIPLKKKWIGQASITVANKKKLLKLLHKSGCEGLFVGFETNSIDSLEEIGKLQNIKTNYIESIKMLHDNGISVLGSFIVGFDSDDKSCFENLAEFVVRSKIDVVDISILTPYPGTVLYEKMKAQRRLLEDKWWLKYHADEVVFKPKLMTREELYQGRISTLREIYKIGPTLKRWIRSLSRPSLFGMMINWKGNMGYRIHAYADAKNEIDLSENALDLEDAEISVN
ncbi:MAG: radical SAM protein [Desulfobacterales bacterium]|jgi:radical SAM superfamily enzyme YgiQ (UPF0313 family)